MSRVAPPPSPQEVERKLSVRSAIKKDKSPKSPAAPVSGTESDSDSAPPPDVLPTSTNLAGLHAGASSHAPLSSIAERRAESGDESEEDEEEEEEGGWKTEDVRGRKRGNDDETVIKTGYLWKKGERRKSWKKRWFVLRPAHLAYYKTSAEYKLLRLLELGDVHSCTPVALKRHDNTFGLVSPVRTYYLQAGNQSEVMEWVKAIEGARHTLMATSTQNTVTAPIDIPKPGSSQLPPAVSPSPPSPHTYLNATSSDSEDGGSPRADRTTFASTQDHPPPAGSSPSRGQGLIPKDPPKIILSGYLLKRDSKRRNWRKRWFVLTGEKLVYSGSHMDTKPHREFSLTRIIDALEYDLPAKSQHPHPGPLPMVSPQHQPAPPEDNDDSLGANTFKIVTTKRTLTLCAPSEEEEIKWLGAVQALIARRAGAGVPGNFGGAAGSAAATLKATNLDPPVNPASASKARRRLSGSGPSGIAVPPSSITEQAPEKVI